MKLQGKNLAIVTYSSRPEIAPDDLPFTQLLKEKAIRVVPAPWDCQMDWTSFDLILLRSCWDYHLRVEEFTKWVGAVKEAKLPLINSPEAVLWNMDKRYLRELQEEGVEIPASYWKGGEKLKKIMKEKAWNKAVIKPFVSASSYKTRLISIEEIDEEELSSDCVLQEYMPEVNIGELSFVFLGDIFSHAVIKKPKAGEFRVQSEYGGEVLSINVSQSLLKQAEQILALVPFSWSYARVDCLERKGKLILMELELIEPSLFLSHSRDGAQLFRKEIERLLF